MKTAPERTLGARGLRIALVRSAFNVAVVEGLAQGAKDALAAMGAQPSDVIEFEAPGAFELPLASLVAAQTGRFDAVIALGAVIKGDTDHYEHVATAATSGLLRASLDSQVPVSFGVLTVEKEEQARVRAAAGPGNKGAEAAHAAVAMVHLLKHIREV